MMTVPLILETDLREVLGEINQSLKRMDERLNRLEIGQARLEERLQATQTRLEESMDSLEQRLETIETEQKILVKDVSDLKGVKALIVPIVVAVTTSVVTLLIRAIPNP
jgi:predicted nuclease with TOPRIM domain